MTEEMILRLGWDAEKVRKGTLSLMDQQKKASQDYVSFWKKAVGDREKLEIDAEVRAAQRSNRARALLRQRHTERVAQFKKELDLQRAASGVSGEAKNLRGVALSNLARNVTGGVTGHGFGANSTAMRELVTVAREASRGNWSRIPGSISILIQSFGKLGTVLSALASPVAGAVAGLAAGAFAVYKLGMGARQTTRAAAEVGLSPETYQTFLRQAGRESGGREAGQSALETFAGSVAGLRGGDMGQLHKFRKYGISVTGAGGSALSNEQIFSNVLSQYSNTTDPARRAAMAMDMFGAGWKKIIKTLDEGAGGMNAAMGKGVQTAGHLAVLEGAAQPIINGWQNFKQGLNDAKNVAINAYVKYAELVNPGLRRLDRETERSATLDKTEQDLIASGRIKPHKLTEAQMELMHPELAADLKSATMRQSDLQNELADRGKMGLSELAAEGRRLSGHIRPRQYTVTARMRTAMKIDDLEAASTRAWERGNDAQMLKLRGEADAMRKANPWLRYQDRNPTQKIEEQLVIANKALKDVQDMAKMVMSEK